MKIDLLEIYLSFQAFLQDLGYDSISWAINDTRYVSVKVNNIVTEFCIEYLIDSLALGLYCINTKSYLYLGLEPDLRKIKMFVIKQLLSR